MHVPLAFASSIKKVFSKSLFTDLFNLSYRQDGSRRIGRFVVLVPLVRPLDRSVELDALHPPRRLQFEVEVDANRPGDRSEDGRGRCADRSTGSPTVISKRKSGKSCEEEEEEEEEEVNFELR